MATDVKAVSNDESVLESLHDLLRKLPVFWCPVVALPAALALPEPTS
jgi:hypothetical protein